MHEHRCTTSYPCCNILHASSSHSTTTLHIGTREACIERALAMAALYSGVQQTVGLALRRLHCKDINNVNGPKLRGVNISNHGKAEPNKGAAPKAVLPFLMIEILMVVFPLTPLCHQTFISYTTRVSCRY